MLCKFIVMMLTVTTRAAIELVLPFRNTTCRTIMEKVLQSQRSSQTKWNSRTDAEISKKVDSWFLDIKPALPLPKTGSSLNIVDIGCGLGMYHVFLREYFQNSSTHFLVDQSRYEIGKYGYEQHSRHGGFHEVHKMPFYTSELCAREIAFVNGFDSNNWHWINATASNLDQLEKADIVMSLLSWGFHYPINVYATAVWRLLKMKGYLILTVRQNKGQEAQLERSGFDCNRVSPQPKSLKRKAYLVVCMKIDNPHGDTVSTHH